MDAAPGGGCRRGLRPRDSVAGVDRRRARRVARRERWRDFAVLLRPADIPNRRPCSPATTTRDSTRRGHLLKVRRLLSFVATGPLADDDALPLIVIFAVAALAAPAR